jgi:hypothetical protein
LTSCTNAFVLLIVVLLLTHNGDSQTVARNLMGNSTSTITRDSQGLQILQNAVNGMHTAAGLTMSDFVAEGQVVLYYGQASSGTINQRGIGIGRRITVINLDSTHSYRLLSNDALGTITTAGNASAPLSPHVSIEQSYLSPIPLILDAISNSQTSVELIADLSSSQFGPHIRVTRHLAGWNPSVPKLNSTSFDILFDPTGATVVRVANLAHFDGNPNHTIPHHIEYSDYRLEGGWLVGHTVEESYAGKVQCRYMLTSFLFNSGLNPSEFVPK